MRLLYRKEAAQEAAGAGRWYEEQQLDLGRAFQDELRRVEKLVLAHSDGSRSSVNRTAACSCAYAVYFRALDEETLEIVTVLHQRRHQ